MSAQSLPRMTMEEFQDMVRSSDGRDEYLDGVVYPAVAATVEHGVIAYNTGSELRVALRDRPCIVTGAGTRIRVLATTFNACPDVIVVCGPLALVDRLRDTITNPLVIMEVLSPSTESWDRGMKLHQYRKIESLREYVLISQNACRVEVFRRDPSERWLYIETEGRDAELHLESLDCRIPLSRIYEKVEITSTGDES